MERDQRWTEGDFVELQWFRVQAPVTFRYRLGGRCCPIIDLIGVSI
jgi:hypothetical protein